MSFEHQNPPSQEAYDAAETYRELIARSQAAPEEQRDRYFSMLVNAHMSQMAAEQDPTGLLPDGLTTLAEHNRLVQEGVRQFEAECVYRDPDDL